ncbi:MAG: hypothetical protein CVV21_10365 [Candidatus Goldiibacteriota bacterium HGW-Goldbacteria-1]|jgi:hypothetical protein|nr:MAG: hypothetical protein CVV21_10365 [Candidatus Goldiibacteriota bacterium HGW-Goldbacteria-1]
MKKIIVMVIAVIFIISCKDMKRVNPTDPAASNYAGMHYTGSIGNLSEVTDFDAYGNDIFIVDETAALLYCFDKNGDEKWETEPDVFKAPKSVHLNNSYIYVLDAWGAPDGNTLTVISTSGILSDFAVNLTANAHKVIVDDSFIYIAYETYIEKYNKDIILNKLNSTNIIIGSAGTADGQFMEISDMCFYNNEIVVADSELDRISFLNLSGGFLRKIEPGTDIKGIDVKDGILYVPCEAGIMEYSCSNGNKLKTWADYGEGNGKVIKPSLIDVNNTFVYVENAASIKVFEP